MSSTNRSDARKQHIADYYKTPVKDIELFLRELNNTIQIPWNSYKIIDPCAGGKIEPYESMSYPEAIKNVFGNCNINCIDIREDSLAETKGDYLQLDVKSFEPNIIITNPPFNQALPIIQKALNDVEDGGYVIMLLRLNFLETKARKEFFDNYMPQYIFVHHKRMSFIKGKGTDSVAYAHYVWQKGNYPEFSKIKVI
ncbi:MAG TPA: hypothetical protein GXZ90_06235 [Clostridiales bacterium]|nr:hypothetical protein [Clostridiales bacterium]